MSRTRQTMGMVEVQDASALDGAAYGPERNCHSERTLRTRILPFGVVRAVSRFDVMRGKATLSSRRKVVTHLGLLVHQPTTPPAMPDVFAAGPGALGRQVPATHAASTTRKLCVDCSRETTVVVSSRGAEQPSTRSTPLCASCRSARLVLKAAEAATVRITTPQNDPSQASPQTFVGQARESSQTFPVYTSEPTEHGC